MKSPSESWTLLRLRQPTEEHVEQAMQVHRNSLEILKKVGECLLKECQAWSASVQAIHKAKQDEEKIIAREAAKQAKAEAKAEQRAKDKAAKRQATEDAKKKASAEAEEADEDQEQDGQDEKDKKKRVRAKAGQNELTEADPGIFHDMMKLPFGAMVCTTTVAGLSEQIAADPSVCCVGRLRTGMLKKVLQDACLQYVCLGMHTIQDCTNTNAAMPLRLRLWYDMLYCYTILYSILKDSGLRTTGSYFTHVNSKQDWQRTLVEECSTFAEKARTMFASPQSPADHRTTLVQEGPAELFSLDSMLGIKAQTNAQMMKASRYHAEVLDRNHIADKRLVGNYNLQSKFKSCIV